MGAISAMLILFISGQYTIALGINNGIFGVIGTIVGHYFGTKQAEGAANMISRTDHDLIQSMSTQIVRSPRSRNRRNQPRNSPSVQQTMQSPENMV